MKLNKGIGLFAMCIMLVCTSFNLKTNATETFNLDVNEDGAIDVLDVITIKNRLVSNNTTDTDTYTNLLYLKKYILKWSYYASEVTTTPKVTTTPTPTTTTVTTTTEYIPPETEPSVTEPEPVVTDERYKSLDEYRSEIRFSLCGYNETGGCYFGASESEIYEMDEMYNNFFDDNWYMLEDSGFTYRFWDAAYDFNGGHYDHGTGDWYLDDALSHIVSIGAFWFGVGGYGIEDNAYIAMMGNGVDCGGYAQWMCYMLYKSGYATRYCTSDNQDHAWYEIWNGSEWIPFNTLGSYYPDDAQYLTVYIP